MAVTAGYDVGGAHLKVALSEAGRVVAVEQVACPLWQGLDRLDAALAQVRSARCARRPARRNHDGRAVRAVPRPAQRRCRDPRSAGRCVRPDSC